MAKGKIFLSSAGEWVELTESQYDLEDTLQGLLADHPDLLAGDQMRPESPRRWLLVSREVGVPDREGGPDRWALDHLFVDQDAVPTLVEVKRSSNAQIRREVVGQMLDYAANMAAHWPPDGMQSLFLKRIGDGDDPAAMVLNLLEPTEAEGDLDVVGTFWARATENLRARHLRLVFVADAIPTELQRIVEFLNESMPEVEVLAVEVRNFIAEGRRILVPRVIGRTSRADDIKEASRTDSVRRDWSVDDLLDAAEIFGGADARTLLTEGVQWALGDGRGLTLGHGKYGPLYLRVSLGDGTTVEIVAIDARGKVEVQFNRLVAHRPFEDADMRIAMTRRLNKLPGVSLDEQLAVRASWPHITLDKLTLPTARRTFFEVLDWAAGLLVAP